MNNMRKVSLVLFSTLSIGFASAAIGATSTTTTKTTGPIHGIMHAGGKVITGVGKGVVTVGKGVTHGVVHVVGGVVGGTKEVVHGVTHMAE